MSISWITLLLLLIWLWCAFWSVPRLLEREQTGRGVSFWGALAAAVLVPPLYLLYCLIDRKFHTQAERLFAELKNLCFSTRLKIEPQGALDGFLRQSGNAALFCELFESALKAHASGILIETDLHKNTMVRFLVKGGKVDHKVFAGPAAEKLLSFLKIAAMSSAPESLVQLQRKKQRWNIAAGMIDGGMNPRATLRIEEKCPALGSSDDLEMSRQEHCRLDEAMKQHDGLILICGTPESGKEEILHALIRDLGAKRRKTAALFDPSAKEGELPGIRRITGAEFPPQCKVLFIAGPASDEVLKKAVQAACSDCLVIAAISGDDVSAVLNTLLEQGISGAELKSALLLTLSTGIVRKLCSCKEAVQLNTVQQNRCRLFGIENGTFFAPRGCGQCNMTGFCGELRISSIAAGSSENGDLEKAAWRLAASGIISPNEAARFTPQTR